jgi:hypothetical protein
MFMITSSETFRFSLDSPFFGQYSVSVCYEHSNGVSVSLKGDEFHLLSDCLPVKEELWCAEVCRRTISYL